MVQYIFLPSPSPQGCVPPQGLGTRRLKAGDYRDVARPLRRLLKRLGSGSAVAGLRQVQESEKAAAEVAQLLGVEPQVRPGVEKLL